MNFDEFEKMIVHSESEPSLSYQIGIAMKRVNKEEQEEQFVFPEMILSKELIEFADTVSAEISLDFEGMTS